MIHFPSKLSKWFISKLLIFRTCWLLKFIIIELRIFCKYLEKYFSDESRIWQVVATSPMNFALSMTYWTQINHQKFTLVSFKTVFIEQKTKNNEMFRILIIIFSAINAGNCPKEWPKLNGWCYQVFEGGSWERSWHAAESHCQSRGGDLVDIQA